MNVFILTPVNFRIAPTLLQALCQNIINVTLLGKKLMGFICSVHLTNMCTNYQLMPDGCVLWLNRHHFFLPITSTRLPWQQIHGHSSRCTVSLQERIHLISADFTVKSFLLIMFATIKDKIPPKMLFTPLARLSCCIILLTCWTELQLPWAQTRDWARSISR